MANTLNKSTDTDQKSQTPLDKHSPQKTKEEVLKTEITETDIERGFKEGLANNSDTEKNSPQQK